MTNNEFNFIRLIQLAVLGLLISGCNGGDSAAQEVKPKPVPKPNIIYILADDLGYGDLSLTGQQKFTTPNIDKLAADGMFFTQHYSGSTVCAPSRSSLMQGLHTGHSFVRGNKEYLPEGQSPIDSSVVTLAEILQDAGYVTGAFGKWGVGFPGSEGDPNFQGFDKFYGYNCQRFGHSYFPYHLWNNQTKVILKGNVDTNKNEYAPTLIHDEALAFLEKNKDTTFFMYYPSVIPHAELAAPESYIAKFRGKLPPEVNYEGTDEGKGYKIGMYASQKEPHATFAAMITLLDDQVGEIRRKVEELGIADNTIIIFTSDNGAHKEAGADPDYFNSSADFRGYKRDLYEGGIRVPMIAYWPGKVKANTTSNHISAFWDFLPTVCDIAEIDSPKGIDGISFLPELLGKEQAQHKYLYWEFSKRGGKQAVRWGDWKGVRLDMTKDPNAPIELYNLSIDSIEANNVAEANPEIIAKIDSMMKEAHVPSDRFPFKYEEKKEEEK
ncbi:MAG: arylsulfatase [Flavobacteriales bacterium]|nr:arylsulfatase [Flavobacteriales bacterium]